MSHSFYPLLEYKIGDIVAYEGQQIDPIELFHSEDEEMEVPNNPVWIEGAFRLGYSISTKEMEDDASFIRREGHIFYVSSYGEAHIDTDVNGLCHMFLAMSDYLVLRNYE